MSYWPIKLLVRTVKTTRNSSYAEGYGQFNKGDRRPVECALLCALAPTDIEIFYQCKFTVLMFHARAGLLLNYTDSVKTSFTFTLNQMLSRLGWKVCQQQLAISRTVLFLVLLGLSCMGVKRGPALKEKHELQMSENKAPRNISYLRRAKTLNNGEFRNLQVT
jgi:hypothetical protein